LLTVIGDRQTKNRPPVLTWVVGLDLTQQGLSPRKKYRASWRSSGKSYRIIDFEQRFFAMLYMLDIL